MFKNLLTSIVVSGGLILNNFQENVERQTKESDLADKHVQISSIAHTELDDLIQEIALEILYSQHPDMKINAEEDTARITKFSQNGEFTFHLDPLDGTYAYTEDRDDFAIGAGISKGTEFIEAMVYLPKKNRIYYANEEEFEVMDELGNPINFERTEPIVKKFVQKRCEEYLSAVESMYYDKLDSMSAHNTMMELVEGNAAVSLYHKAAPHDFGIPKIILEAVGGVCTDQNGEGIKFSESFERVEYFFAFASSKIKDQFFDRVA